MRELLAELFLAALAVALLTALRSWRQVGFRALPVAWVAIVNISRMRFEEFVLFLALACIMQALAPMGLWRAAILSSIVFARCTC